jgi:hypothetical protein
VLASYCKNPRGCAGIVLLADDADYSEAVCCSMCGTTFCAACDMPPHAPATCDMVRSVRNQVSQLSLLPLPPLFDYCAQLNFRHFYFIQIKPLVIAVYNLFIYLFIKGGQMGRKRRLY